MHLLSYSLRQLRLCNSSVHSFQDVIVSKSTHNTAHSSSRYFHLRQPDLAFQRRTFVTTATRLYSNKAPNSSSSRNDDISNGKTRQSQQDSRKPEAQTEEEDAGLPDALDLLPGAAAIAGAAGIGGGGGGKFTGYPLLDIAISTVVGLSIVFIGGVAYLKWYKWHVLYKIEKAFAPGYDPALELATRSESHRNGIIQEGETEELEEVHLRRKEQDMVDRIIRGEESHRYFVVIGSKGTGKTTMMYDAMKSINADGIAMCEAHPDLEVFRLRLGKSLNYEFNEDSQTGLFQRRDPREGGPALDIERALNKLEKVALRLSRIRGRPLVLILNNVHFFQHNDEGRNMLLQLQQRAEAWAESGILTMVFSSDDFWPFLVLRKSASRMQVLSIYDLNSKESLVASKRLRRAAKLPLPETESTPNSTLHEVLSIIGGRLAYLNKVCRSHDMLRLAKHLLAAEKGWLLSQIGLIEDCDDDVMDEQKWSSCSWLLLREFVKIWKEKEQERAEQFESGTLSSEDEAAGIPMPTIPYWRCRQIMTRADFLDDLDKANIISVDINHDVRPDSMLILHAAREVVEEEGFDEVLDSVRDRIDEIESLHRTRELTFKDLKDGDRINLIVDKGAWDGRLA